MHLGEVCGLSKEGKMKERKKEKDRKVKNLLPKYFSTKRKVFLSLKGKKYFCNGTLLFNLVDACINLVVIE
jgi:hypothetical protein